MMPTPSHQLFEHCLSVIRQASVEILNLLDQRVGEGKEPRWFLEQLDQARLNLGGWASVAKKLNLNDAELSEFTLQLRHLQKLVPRYERGQPVTDNQLIAAARMVVALELVRQRQPLLTFGSDSAADAEQLEALALRQLRMIQLALAALVRQVWPETTRLHNHLKLQFGAERVRRWLSRSEGGDILSGMQFSELALLVIDKKAFSRDYSSLFYSQTNLTLLAEPRLTLHAFLEDIRQIRAAVVGKRAISSTAFLLLDIYARQIATPLQRAYEQGRTLVNPASLMSADGNVVQHFWDEQRDFSRLYGADDEPVHDAIERMRKGPTRTPEARERLISTGLWAAVGVMVLVMVVGGIWMFNSSPVTTPASASATPAPGIEAPSRDSPRTQLANRGINWDINGLRSAIDRNDAEVVQLFMRGGMEWQLAWTEQALSAQHDEVIALLLRYRLQMDEPKPCRRFITTLGHALAGGEPLSGERKDILQTFCTRPAVVDAQRLEVEKASRRASAQPTAHNTQWLKIQSDIYAVIK
ncbi:STY4199 family HEPN domain-containing protein [Pseudocitrobacter cyperus]|uniref:STY4199 family HEPN domain-containing protein n=1 Tax=Pseudocitrobacter cyperus TaxID=3112843 RepID=A0ABV0HPN2_9ENTR